MKHLIVILLFSINLCYASTQIGVLVPAEFNAMEEIVAGFTQQLAGHDVNIVVKNAQGDINLQRAILNQFANPKYAMVAAIGVNASEMAMHKIHDKPIIAIAANMKKTHANVVALSDDIDIAQQVAFIQTVLPDLQHITLVHSTNDKVYDEVQTFKRFAKQHDIHVQTLMMQQLSDLYSMRAQIDKRSQAIFVLKDIPVVSGIAALAASAQQRQIPLITSDDGSVKSGADFAFGISEKQIGITSAQLVEKLLSGIPVQQIPSQHMTQYSVFINPALPQRNRSLYQRLLSSAKQAKLAII